MCKRAGLDARPHQPGSDHFRPQIRPPPPAPAEHKAAPANGHDAADDLSLQASLNRLEHNLDRLEQLIDHAD